MSGLHGQRAIVTGASKGIGRATAEKLADEGMKLALLARSETLLAERVADCEERGATARAFRCDVGDAGQVDAQIAAAIEWLDGIDVLVNNAGLGYFGSVEQLAVAEFDEMVATNLRGVFLCTRAVVPTMDAGGGGVIVNIASIAGKGGFPGGGGYSASKFGVMGLTESLSLDLRERNIRVTAICPGSVNAPDFNASGTSKIPPEQKIQASDVADLVAYVAALPDRIHLREIEVRVTHTKPRAGS